MARGKQGAKKGTKFTLIKPLTLSEVNARRLLYGLKPLKSLTCLNK